MFSAHGLPMKVVEKGDVYVTQVAATAELIMKELGLPNANIMSWQSKGKCTFLL